MHFIWFTREPDLLIELEAKDPIPTYDVDHDPREEKITRYHFLVSAASLRLASPVWNRILNPNNGFKPLPETTINGKTMRVLTLHDDDVSAIGWVLNIVHFHADQVPRELNYENFMAVTILCDKYDIRNAVCPWAEMWVKPLLPSGDAGIIYPNEGYLFWEGIEDWLFIKSTYRRIKPVSEKFCREIINQLVDEIVGEMEDTQTGLREPIDYRPGQNEDPYLTVDFDLIPEPIFDEIKTTRKSRFDSLLIDAKLAIAEMERFEEMIEVPITPLRRCLGHGCYEDALGSLRDPGGDKYWEVAAVYCESCMKREVSIWRLARQPKVLASIVFLGSDHVGRCRQHGTPFAIITSTNFRDSSPSHFQRLRSPSIDRHLKPILCASPTTLHQVAGRTEAPRPSERLDWTAFRDELEMEISNSAADRPNYDGEPKASYKSWKKKYRKLRHKFEGVMKRSDELFKQDLVATATIKRITEENNRLLDLLLELNDNERIQRKHHQNIGTPSSATPPRMMSPGTLEEFLTRKFYVDDPIEEDGGPDAAPPAAAVEPEPMDIDPSASVNTDAATTTAQTGTSTVAASPSAPSPQFASNGVAHDPSKPLTPPLQPVDKPVNRREVPPPAEPEYSRGGTPPRFRETSPFLNPIEDEELPPGTIVHYHQEDSAFTSMSLPAASPMHSKFPAATNASIPAAATEEDHHWPRNPMSVYCWLRRYQPQVFLQDNEAPGGKERKKKAKRSAEDDEDEHGRPGHGPSSPAEPKPRRGGTRISFVGGGSGASEAAEGGKVVAGTKRRRAQKDEGGEDTPEKEGRGGRGKGSGSTKPPAAKKPRKSGVMKKEED
ncbi:hypothetical protein DRE_00226 [Drechslerella stenobrocha 248]|uniref:BTB domain-containing protein n=1 Tax=Drechslerella stenobrocha 248 TaxID=1043628 RepID=W7HXJ0_9PEZI|nr:hypothetical protein DRE_00226 [Drechslerella stenobrocha 248]